MTSLQFFSRYSTSHILIYSVNDFVTEVRLSYMYTNSYVQIPIIFLNTAQVSNGFSWIKFNRASLILERTRWVQLHKHSVIFRSAWEIWIQSLYILYTLSFNQQPWAAKIKVLNEFKSFKIMSDIQITLVFHLSPRFAFQNTMVYPSDALGHQFQSLIFACIEQKGNKCK